MNLIERLPNMIELGGREYSIYTDFRVWLRFEISLKHAQPGDNIPCGYLFKNEQPRRVDVRELITFCRPKHELPRPTRGSSDDAIALDFELDADLIYAAFLQQYGIDLIDVEELHWHKFLALIRGLKGTKLDEIMGYRCYKRQTNKDIDPYEELRDAWEIIPELSAAEQAELDAFSAAFTPPDPKEVRADG